MERLTLIKHEVRQLGSQNPDRSLMYPGDYAFTWIKCPGMPWVLAGMAPYEPEQSTPQQ